MLLLVLKFCNLSASRIAYSSVKLNGVTIYPDLQYHTLAIQRGLTFWLPVRVSSPPALQAPWAWSSSSLWSGSCGSTLCPSQTCTPSRDTAPAASANPKTSCTFLVNNAMLKAFRESNSKTPNDGTPCLNQTYARFVDTTSCKTKCLSQTHVGTFLWLVS